MKKLIFLFTLAFITLVIASCDDDNEEKDRLVTIPIEKVVATAPIDLEQRTDWIFFVGNNPYINKPEQSGYEYKYTVDLDKITATPKSVEEVYNMTYYIPKNPELSIHSLNIGITFRSPQYPSNFGRELEDGALIDQSTKEQLLAYDLLYSYSYAETNEQLYDLQLKHAHSLLELKLPEKSEITGVTIVKDNSYYDSDKIHTWKPYKTNASNYQAIVISDYTLTYSLLIEEGGKTYNIALRESSQDALNYDYYYTFNIEKDGDEYKIASATQKEWSENKWKVE